MVHWWWFAWCLDLSVCTIGKVLPAIHVSTRRNIYHVCSRLFQNGDESSRVLMSMRASKVDIYMHEINPRLPSSHAHCLLLPHIRHTADHSDASDDEYDDEDSRSQMVGLYNGKKCACVYVGSPVNWCLCHRNFVRMYTHPSTHHLSIHTCLHTTPMFAHRAVR